MSDIRELKYELTKFMDECRKEAECPDLSHTRMEVIVLELKEYLSTWDKKDLEKALRKEIGIRNILAVHKILQEQIFFLSYMNHLYGGMVEKTYKKEVADRILN